MLVLLALLWLPSPGFTDSSVNQTFQNGHNLTATSDTLEPGHCSIGIPVTACGIARGLNIGTSPWMLLDYNMYSVAARVLLAENEAGHRWALQASYFKTNRRRNIEALHSTYQMKSIWTMLIRTWNLRPHYRLHGNFHANYYFDEKMPFSIRRPYATRTPYQFNLSLLHEVDLAAGWFIFGEMGLLDFARKPLHVHGGASIGKMIGGFSARLGFSVTGSLPSLFSPNRRIDYQQQLRFYRQSGYNGRVDPELAYYDYALHPEFSLQYTF